MAWAQRADDARVYRMRERDVARGYYLGGCNGCRMRADDAADDFFFTSLAAVRGFFLSLSLRVCSSSRRRE